MSDDRKKRLEELKRRNEEAKKKLENAKTTPTVNSLLAPQNTTNPTNSTTSTTPISNTVPKPGASSVDELIKAVTNKTAGDLNIEEIKKITNKRTSRYGGDNLSYFKMEQSILGVTTETYEMEVQCNIKTSENDSEGEQEPESKQAGQGYRRSIIGMKNNKKNPFGPSTSKKPETRDFQLDDKVVTKFIEEDTTLKPKVVVNEEMRRQIMNSTELESFLNTNTKYVERVSI